MEEGKKFVIEAPKNDEKHVYIESATLNGKPFTKNYLKYSDITNGGSLKLNMSATPVKDRGTSKEDRPFSVSK